MECTDSMGVVYNIFPPYIEDTDSIGGILPPGPLVFGSVIPHCVADTDSVIGTSSIREGLGEGIKGTYQQSSQSL
jgi:hypothetical protein